MRGNPLNSNFAETLDTDVLVIGGGFAGMFTAYFLAQDGLEVILIDQGDFGTKASGVNAGNIHQQLMTYNYHTYGWDWFERWSIIGRYFKESFGIWQMLAREVGPALSVDVCGGLTVCENEQQLDFLRRKVELEKLNGIETVMVNRSDLTQMAPYISDRAAGACYCKVEGKINPLVAMPALLNATLATGSFRAFRHCRANNARKGRGHYTVTTSLGLIRCRRLVNASGAGAMDVASSLGIPLKVEKRPIQMLATEAAEPFMHHLLYHAKERMSLKQVSNGNVLVGGGWLASVDRRTGLAIVNRESIQGSLKVGASVVPKMLSLNLLRCWGGIIFTPPDGLPVVDRVSGQDGVFFAISNQFGVTLGPLVGRTIAEMIRGKSPSVDVKPLSIARPAVLSH